MKKVLFGSDKNISRPCVCKVLGTFLKQGVEICHMAKFKVRLCKKHVLVLRNVENVILWLIYVTFDFGVLKRSEYSPKTPAHGNWAVRVPNITQYLNTVLVE